MEHGGFAKYHEVTAAGDITARYDSHTHTKLKGRSAGAQPDLQTGAAADACRVAVLPTTSSFAAAASELMREDFFKEADTILILTDTDCLSSERISKHFMHIGPILFDRTTISGFHDEHWAILYHKTDNHDPKIHCTWAAVFLLEALIAAAPWKHYILQDHDDTPLALFEVRQLVNLVKTFHLPFFTRDEADLCMIVQNEESTPANAGQVIFPAKQTLI